MKRKTIALMGIALVAIVTISTLAFLTPSRSLISQEPKNLQELVEFTGGTAHLRDLTGVERAEALNDITTYVEGFFDIFTELSAKGYIIEYETLATISRIDGTMPDGITTFGGVVLTCWSTGMGHHGSKACLTAALMDDGTNIVTGSATNVLNPEFVPETDPYIIVNAMPYLYVDWYWYYGGRVVYWYYWWHDSHSHQGWFWSPYWYWRIYLKYYCYDVYYPWYWWWWHWYYWRHWYWWSSWFPYYW